MWNKIHIYGTGETKSVGWGITNVKQNCKLPFKIGTHTTFLNLLQHLEPKIKDLSCNTQLLQYAECKSCIIVQSIGNLQTENSKHASVWNKQSGKGV